MLALAMLTGLLPVTCFAAKLNEYDENNGLIAYNGFSVYAVSGAYGATVHSAPAAGAIMQVTFRDCTAIELYGGTGVDRAYADIYLDGELVKSIDTYSQSVEKTVLFYSVSGLERGEHVLKLVVSENKNSASVGTWVEVDMVASDGVLIEKAIEIKDPEEGNQIIDDTLLSYSEGWTSYSLLDASRGFYKNTAY